jgi:protein-L-isoaspartate(D-aspartate) O-methyltransferase
MQDTFKHMGMRRKLVDGIRIKGIQDERVLSALEKIPRHLFLDSSFTEIAYQDKPFPIGSGQTISQPYTVAFQTELLNIVKGEKILEIGTGSGYQACVLAEMGAKVFTIERHKALFTKTKKFLADMGYKVNVFYGDGYLGLPSFAPFDKILVTAGANTIPEELLKQLKTGGLLVIPLGGSNTQIMTRITKMSETTFEKEEFGTFRFVPLLTKKAE